MLGTILKVEIVEMKQEVIYGVNKGFQNIAELLAEQQRKTEIIEEHLDLKSHKN